MGNEADWIELFITLQLIGGLIIAAFMWGARKDD